MNHTPCIVDSVLHYYDFRISNAGSLCHSPVVELPSFSGEEITAQIVHLANEGFYMAQVTALQAGTLDYINGETCVGGMSPTNGVVVLFQQTCCNRRLSLKMALSQSPALASDVAFWAKWSYAHIACGDSKGSKQILQMALGRFPDNAPLTYDLACMECQLGNVESSKRLLDKAILLDSKFDELSKTDHDLFPLFMQESVRV